ncbi:uncharacterized protein BO88DRAFT_455938 [Aspergillus vadensis CBS 113365]|uniref:Uncharacterized protein n=1 Tax=Aspergillus vadensis (strain CBS 113365 / IMI 142717 / IBT 24658) TaxID=1448311 RepID=A0A319CDT1_ASPVC|nr:hypothetical protein BO88DRAFT_455938 [Aspergillus vadensis CBS 113365]PYH66532.1 hypothetical protein BO88DRAFT_455938 [Aspergillus vadensis CBS 113365]
MSMDLYQDIMIGVEAVRPVLVCKAVTLMDTNYPGNVNNTADTCCRMQRLAPARSGVPYSTYILYMIFRLLLPLSLAGFSTIRADHVLLLCHLTLGFYIKRAQSFISIRIVSSQLNEASRKSQKGGNNLKQTLQQTPTTLPKTGKDFYSKEDQLM